jgi:hypothetical protein
MLRVLLTNNVLADRSSRTVQGRSENDNIPVVGQRDAGYGLACVQDKVVLIQIEGAIVPLSLAIIAIEHGHGFRLPGKGLWCKQSLRFWVKVDDVPSV